MNQSDGIYERDNAGTELRNCKKTDACRMGASKNQIFHTAKCKENMKLNENYTHLSQRIIRTRIRKFMTQITIAHTYFQPQ